ncbi:MAG TPA: hypothetical protein VHE30_18980 [Polyangiaceae bacterium]|nr:hypothetical protein [Polyangiaceae bacterium]
MEDAGTAGATAIDSGQGGSDSGQGADAGDADAGACLAAKTYQLPCLERSCFLNEISCGYDCSSYGSINGPGTVSVSHQSDGTWTADVQVYANMFAFVGTMPLTVTGAGLAGDAIVPCGYYPDAFAFVSFSLDCFTGAISLTGGCNDYHPDPCGASVDGEDDLTCSLP